MIYFETQKKVPLEVREGTEVVLLFEIEISTGRSRTSIYRDMKAIGIEPMTLVKRKIPIIPVAELWKFSRCKWFHEYAQVVRNKGLVNLEADCIDEEVLTRSESVFKLIKLGLTKEQILDLVVTGFIPCHKVPGNYLVNRGLFIRIKASMEAEKYV